MCYKVPVCLCCKEQTSCCWGRGKKKKKKKRQESSGYLAGSLGGDIVQTSPLEEKTTGAIRGEELQNT